MFIFNTIYIIFNIIIQNYSILWAKIDKSVFAYYFVRINPVDTGLHKNCNAFSVIGGN